MAQTRKMSTRNMVLGAVLTALVFMLQYMGSFVKFGPFSISLVLIPIVIGAATCGKWIGAWLGFVFGAAVLLNGDAAGFQALNLWGTNITVLAKGLLCGLLSSVAYEAVLGFCNKISLKNGRYIAVVVAAIVCPVVNTGVFILGCLIFLFNDLSAEAGGTNVLVHIITAYVTINFIIELAANIILSPVISRLVDIRKRKQ
ncbi:MAG: ECF transporter S component [Clostridia bacterium]|nr:ECF transporter S component [Clostridia bacterium]